MVENKYPHDCLCYFLQRCKHIRYDTCDFWRWIKNIIQYDNIFHTQAFIIMPFSIFFLKSCKNMACAQVYFLFHREWYVCSQQIFCRSLGRKVHSSASNAHEQAKRRQIWIENMISKIVRRFISQKATVQNIFTFLFEKFANHVWLTPKVRKLAIEMCEGEWDSFVLTQSLHRASWLRGTEFEFT